MDHVNPMRLAWIVLPSHFRNRSTATDLHWLDHKPQRPPNGMRVRSVRATPSFLAFGLQSLNQFRRRLPGRCDAHLGFRDTNSTIDQDSDAVAGGGGQ